MRLVAGFYLSLVLAASVVAEVTAEPELHFLTEHSPPSQYINEAGQIDGVTIQLIQHLQQQLGERLRFSLLPWARAMELAKAEPNTVLFETVRTPAREAQFQWVGPLKYFDMQLYTLPEVVAHPADFAAARLRGCAYRSSAQLGYFKQLGFEEGRNLSVVANAHECQVMAERGRAEVIALNALRYGEFFHMGDVTLQRWQPLYHSYLYLAFSPAIPVERVQRWQDALQQSYLDGTMRRLYQADYPADMIEQLEQYWQADY
ncbi:substrate-binding periplasmic protein [Alkalimonas amylolytica]|uniref:Polar amino acid transport system substrate-binding protein n=1 Tax=Alkalimonas amylolytica TaxID=152573 RepID=A0A1H4EIR9_ALKAM|nr:transporter substrate-binding domain-containing protein [Alkalimonas amylolytica]SEA84913.1 polar amino acid transport system substrate-binding protein [Alkalimonas amylolytica]